MQDISLTILKGPMLGPAFIRKVESPLKVARQNVISFSDDVDSGESVDGNISVCSSGI